LKYVEGINTNICHIWQRRTLEETGREEDRKTAEEDQ
jgi:hypothetical protein